MPTPVYPSLSSYAGALIKPTEVIPSLIRFMYYTSPNRSDFYESELRDYKLSFRKIEANYGHDPRAVVQRLSDELSEVLSRYFPTLSLKTTVYYKFITEDGKDDEVDPETEGSEKLPRYNVYIDIVQTLPSGIVLGTILRGIISVDHLTHKFDIKFEATR